MPIIPCSLPAETMLDETLIEENRARAIHSSAMTRAGRMRARHGSRRPAGRPPKEDQRRHKPDELATACGGKLRPKRK